MELEEKRNKLNLELRMLLSVLDLIDGIKREYPDYVENSGMTEEEYLDQQLMLIVDAKDRLINVFKN